MCSSDLEKILLIGQIPHDTAVQHVDYIKWCEDTIIEIKKQTDREIVFRPHPLGKKYIQHLQGVTYSNNTLEEDFKEDRKSTRLNSSHGYISYAVFCLKKKKNEKKKKNNTQKKKKKTHNTTYPHDQKDSA